MAPTLSEALEELEEDEEEEEEGVGEPAGFLCGCGDGEFIKLGEDIACVHLAVPYAEHDNEIGYSILLDSQGEPVAEPLFFRYECWENVGQELSEVVEDQPPQDDARAFLHCDYCASAIFMGEKCATVHLGEFGLSERLGDVTFIESDNDPYVICLPCVRLMVDSTPDRFEAFGFWKDHVCQFRECPICTQAHCWRAGRCFCKCHAL